MTKDLTQGSPAGLIFGFAAPLLAGMLFQQMYNLVDTMIVGRFLGVAALAGVGATGSISFLVLGFGMGICSGFAIPVAQYFGARNESRMRHYAANGLVLSGVIALLLTVVTVVFCRDILSMMDTPAACFEEAYQYIVIVFAGIPFIFLYNLLSGYLRSLGDSRTPLLFLLLSSVLNVVLDLAFILLFKMGIAGASLATVISQGVSALLCLLFIVRKVPALHISREEWALSRKTMAELCRYGVPMGFQYSITAVGTVVLQTAINALGATAVAAVAASSKVLNFIQCPFEALGATMATYGAQNVGASRYDRLDRGVVSAALMGFAYSVLAYLIAYVLGDSFVRLFASGEGSAELIDLAHQHMKAYALFYPLLTLVNVVRLTIQGMGYSMIAVVAGVMEMIARALVGIFLVPVWGIVGAALGGPLAWVFADVFLIPTYFFCKRAVMGRVHHMNPEKKSEKF